jgi:hypothetical protein
MAGKRDLIFLMESKAGLGGSGWSTALGDTTGGVSCDPKDVSDFKADVLIDADGWRFLEPL